MLALRHSLHRKATDARGFYAIYAGMIAIAAALVLFGSDALLGLLTTPCKRLPACSCHPQPFPAAAAAVRWQGRPWTLGERTGAEPVHRRGDLGVGQILSIILTVATAFPDMMGQTILAVLGCGTALGIAGFAVLTVLRAYLVAAVALVAIKVA